MVVGSEAKSLTGIEEIPSGPPLPPLSQGESLETGIFGEKAQTEVLKSLVRNEVLKQLDVMKAETAQEIKEIGSTKRRWIEKVRYSRHYYV